MVEEVLWTLVHRWESEARDGFDGIEVALNSCADDLRALLGCQAPEHSFDVVDHVTAFGKVIQRRVRCVHCNKYEWRIP